MDDGHTFKLTSSDGTSLFARHWAAKDGFATLALVHGFGEHSGRYTDMATHLNDRGIDVVAIDLRGHGRSDGKRGVIRSYDDFRADLAALLERARQIHGQRSGPLILYGHSMGGGVVLDHGLRPNPGVSGIIASAPLVAPADPVSGVLRLIVTALSKILPKAAMKNGIDGTKISTLPAEQAAYEQDALNHGSLGLRTAVEIIENGETLLQDADRWSIPLLMMHARDDALTDYEASQQFGKKARADFRTFDNAAHEVHNDHCRQTVYKTMTDFVDLLAGRI